MGWETRRNGKSYYYRKVWRDGRVCSEYVGNTGRADVIAAFDTLERERCATDRHIAREQQAIFADATQSPAALATYTKTVRQIVADVLKKLGFHQHRGQWRKRRMNELTERTLEAAFAGAQAIYSKKQPSAEELSTFRHLLSEHTILAHVFGDTAELAKQTMMRSYQATPALNAAVQSRMAQIATELGYADASELERLLIDEITLRWLDLYRTETAYGQQTSDALKVKELERWERVLASKQARYLKAVESLARVRRLLKLPAVQVNIAAAGGKQVNLNTSIPFVEPYETLERG